MPAAAPSPSALEMSRKSFTVRYRGRGADDDRQVGPDGEPRAGAGRDAPVAPPPHELERYAGLFASRTRVMKSSAMRDLMAMTERPEVISLAGGLPDTSTFPPERFAALMSHVAARVDGARRSSTARPRAWRRSRLHRRGDGAGGHARSIPTRCSSRPAASR